jgi:SAM-dependent methyltransferase
MGEWFEDESLWRDFYPVMFADERLRQGADEVQKALVLAGFSAPEGRAVLDLGCGPGRHAVPLAERGFQVTGVDRTAFLLEQARERARLTGVRLELVQADMREFRRPESYDLALSLFTSFGYFQARADDLLVLRNVRRSLRPRGVFVMDMLGKECLARNFQRTRSRTLADGAVLIERSEIVEDWTRVDSEWILLRGDRARIWRFRLSVYCVAPGPVMTRMLAGVPEAIREKIVARVPVGRIARPDEIAAVHAFLASDDAAYITGQVLFVDGGMSVGV